MPKALPTRVICFISLLILATRVSWGADAGLPEFRVGTAEEFVQAIGSNRIIRLEPGSYDLSACKRVSTPSVTWQNIHGDFELVIRNVENLSIEGPAASTARLLVRPINANVLIFKDCAKIAVRNIEAGHSPETGGCTGAVLCFIDCREVTIENTVLYGSGSYGLVLTRANGLLFKDSIIQGCSYGIISAVSSKNLDFERSKFQYNEEFDMFELQDCGQVVIALCEITNNKISSSILGCALFDLLNTEVRLVSTLVAGNSGDYLYKAFERDALILEDTDVSANTWFKGRYLDQPRGAWLALEH